MNGFDKYNDFDFLKNRQLIQICIGAHQLILNFTENLSIEIESEAYLIQPNGTIVEFSGVAPKSYGYLVCLLEKKIEFAQIKYDSELNLYFSDGYSLSITDSNENTESFIITMDDINIVI